ncbi:hypothetical protein Hanom_Chr14g01294411 [Helianthus anomalus]
MVYVDVQMTKETGAQLTSIDDEQTPLNNHHQQINPRAASFANSRRLKSNQRSLPNRSLIAGSTFGFITLCFIIYCNMLVMMSLKPILTIAHMHFN